MSLSACYFTPQYKGMEKLYKSFKEKGFEVLGFPCNQFAEEEKGTNEEILNFCTSQFDVSFPMFEKIEVNGTNAHPLFKFLKKAVKGFLGSESIKWNFSKFLVDQSGNVVKRYGSLDAPEAIEGDVKKFTLRATALREHPLYQFLIVIIITFSNFFKLMFFIKINCTYIRFSYFKKYCFG